jgi:hypothetical protein
MVVNDGIVDFEACTIFDHFTDVLMALYVVDDTFLICPGFACRDCPLLRPPFTYQNRYLK